MYDFSSRFERSHLHVIPYAATIFISAFLIFQVQPIIAKFILPWYGGTPAVWTTCLLFFQAGLLMGYTYAHLIATYLGNRKQVFLHVGLLIISLAFIPVIPGESWKPDGTGNPILGIIGLLSSTVGFPYLLISATGPLLQHWYARRYPGNSPYRLFALSNLGSLLGLLSYPFLFEPVMTMRSQMIFWSMGYGLYILICGWTGMTLYRMTNSKDDREGCLEKSGQKLGFMDPLHWMGLAACGTIMLMASTNKITQDVAPIPFLWILPLSLYLITFMITFNNPRWYNRYIWISTLLLSLPALVIMLNEYFGAHKLHITVQIIIYSLGLFFCCMVCHGEIVRHKPPPRQLTAFYLMVSFGGVLGGAFVNFLAPVLFTGFWEYHTGLMMISILVGFSLFRNPDKPPGKPLLLTGKICWGAGVLALGIFLNIGVAEQSEDAVASRRNFYGVLRVVESRRGGSSHQYKLYHGGINHGMQFREEKRRRWPTTYFSKYSGVGIAIRKHSKWRYARNSSVYDPEKAMKVGVIGLGIGTTAVYCNRGDIYRFYEINPEVETLARDYFSYLSNARGKVEVILGDGRISLERELRETGPLGYDVLVVDAFSGDAIPAHLLTREAFELYWKHIRPDGVLALHISNRHINLKPVARGLARILSKETIMIKNRKNFKWGIKKSTWVLLSSNPAFMKKAARYSKTWPTGGPKEVIWTDDYSNLMQLLKN